MEKLGIGISVPSSIGGIEGQLYPPNPLINEQPAKPRIKKMRMAIIKQQQHAPRPIPHLAPLDIPCLGGGVWVCSDDPPWADVGVPTPDGRREAAAWGCCLAEPDPAPRDSLFSALCSLFSSAIMVLLYIILKKSKKGYNKINMAQKIIKKRPYWHVDAKWISGIIFLVFFITGILFLNISQIISQKNALDIASSKIESSIKEEVSQFFDKNGKPLVQDKKIILSGLNTAKDKVEELKNNAEDSAKEINPLNFGKDLARLAAYKLEGLMYARVSDALGTAADKISALDLKEANIKDKIMAEITIPKVYSQKQYLRYRNDAIIFLFAALLFLVTAIYFSSGFGRLSTPGFLILMASMPGFFMLMSFDNYLKTSPLNNLLSSNQKIVRVLAEAILNAFKEQSSSILAVYKYLFFSALILLVIGILGSVLLKLFAPKPTTDISPRLK
ncbi:MAG: Uncharacterized protein CEN92_465 [Candidatus Berkelbacteria bacterium Licking1014_96]|uniref:Uncharacterized protein n=1 Tax=Candidatus Berkelbacteria bacterium Licking1014_96 TaxID=2017149 RepID=A0A554LCM9_9BACT|nr:MAG: Uncharacterized protein CEN92_465 [Candidatus Berkelbacteria bacterium Licking1014_96]